MGSTMLRRLLRPTSLAILLAAGVAGGCYEETTPAPQSQSAAPPAPPEQPAPSGAPTGVDEQPGSAYAGAVGAAHNTVDRIEQRQQELEKALEDN
jgi:hypothetical protein